MARAIHKLEWLQVEEDLCRTALLEYLMEHEHWLWERPLSGGHESPLVPEPNQGHVASRERLASSLARSRELTLSGACQVR